MADLPRRMSLLLAMALLQCPIGCKRSAESDNRDVPTVQAVDFAEHLRLAADQMRRQLYSSAAAELQKCSQIKPDDTELLFQSARLELAKGGGAPAAVPLLEQALARRPEMPEAHRLLYILHRATGKQELAAKHRAAFEQLYGALGTVELEATDYQLGWRSERPVYSVVHEPTLQDDPQTRFARAAGKLERTGLYDPGVAVEMMESIFRDYPDAPALRLYYAQTLLFREVRIQATDRPELPPVSSRLIIDYAQGHFEHVLDQCVPRLPIADRARHGLAEAALRMADYDDAVMHLDNLLTEQTLEAKRRGAILALKGVARFKQGRYPEAVVALEQSLAGDTPATRTYFSKLWSLHLTYEAAGIAADQRRFPFRLRNDLSEKPNNVILQFEDIAATVGINKFDGLGPSAWSDYDHDGDFDLFVCGCDSYGALYRNDGDTFRDVTAAAGLLRVQSGFSATFQDYDNDGWRDLYIGRDGWNGPVPNSLYRNNGDGTFTDVTESAGVGHPGSSFVHAWFDYDRDGFLDLYIANGITGGGDTNVLYRNNGDGTFTDATASAGLAERPGVKTIGFAVGDYDKDGWSDIFVGGWNYPHRLYHNRGDGTFEEVASAAGLTTPQWELQRYVSIFFDYDNDAYPDLLMTRLAPWQDVLVGLSDHYQTIGQAGQEALFRKAPKLYRNNRDGTFTDVSRKAGLLYPVGIMGANVADLDNDGYQDIYFATGDPNVARMEPDRFFHNNADGTFSDWTFATGLGNLGKGHGVTFIDFDGDGDLEIYVPEGGFVHGDAWENAFYLNRQTTGNHWLHIDLAGEKSNRDAVGTSITIVAGGMTQLREVKGGRGFGSTDSPTVEFGLGKAEVVDSLVIRWPAGLVQTFQDVPADQRIHVVEGRHWISDVPPR